jgi:arsenate reductase
LEKVIIWHNPRCRKSREALQRLREKGVEPEVFEYLKENFTSEQLINLIKQSHQPLVEFIRKNEPKFKDLGLKDKNLTVENFARLAVQYPVLLERPIVIKGDRIVLARPASRIQELW